MTPPTLGCVLAGGAGRRMGAPKAGLPLAGRPLVAHVVARLRPQCAALVIAGDPLEPALLATGLRVEPDAPPGRLGPLAGVLTALRHALGRFPFVLTVPVDTPFLPPDLVGRLHAARGDAEVVRAASGGRPHHVVALWSSALAPDLARDLDAGVRRVEEFVETRRTATAHWEATPGDPFDNLNTPGDLARAEARLARD